MDVKFLLAASLVLAAVFTRGAQAASPWQRESYALPTTHTAPKIDGELNDACWKPAFKVGEFVRFTGSAPLVVDRVSSLQQ